MVFSSQNKPLNVALKMPTKGRTKAFQPAKDEKDAVKLMIVTAKTALRLDETYRAHSLDPVFYFERRDLDQCVLINDSTQGDQKQYSDSLSVQLRENRKSTYCPLKGRTVYLDAFLDNVLVTENVAWSYTTITNPDPRAHQIKDLIAFDSRLVTINPAA